jgi:hypothetical protein
VRLRYAELASPWFPWAFVGTDHIEHVARDAGLGEVETWTVDGRWFAAIGSCSVSSGSLGSLGSLDGSGSPGSSGRAVAALLRNAYGQARGCL